MLQSEVASAAILPGLTSRHSEGLEERDRGYDYGSPATVLYPRATLTTTPP